MIHEGVCCNRQCSCESYEVGGSKLFDQALRGKKGSTMARHLVVSDRILQVMRGTPDGKLDDSVAQGRSRFV